MCRPVALVSCWVDANPPQDCEPPRGFHVGASLVEKASHHNSQLFTDLPLYPGQNITVGRDHHENAISINHPYVSKKHFVIYSVIYDLEDTSSQPPQIYVRDCQSLDGTYVDDVCIGNKKNPSTGFYLSRDVEVTIKPHWKFRISLLDHPDLESPLSAIQLRESSLFNDRYIITNRTLGSGSFASVHLAVDVNTGKQVACKIHNLDRLRESKGSEYLVKRAIDETDILGKLRHPNLPTFEYAFRSSHTLYALTELATGGDLYSMRLKHGVFEEYDCKPIIQQIVSAIQYLHNGNIAHRDLKPENILFMIGPELNGRLIVGDLGFAKSLASGRMTSRVGTTHYIAPEVDGHPTHGLAVDMWSLGMVTMFLVVADHNAIPSRFATINQAAIDGWLDAVFKDRYHEDISSECQDFIRSCLMFEPRRRMKASDAMRHRWLRRLGRGGAKSYKKGDADTWKPPHTISPPVQELPEVEDIEDNIQPRGDDAAYTPPTTRSGKRRFADAGVSVGNSQNPQESPYFEGSQPQVPKRLKTSVNENRSLHGSERSEPSIYTTPKGQRTAIIRDPYSIDQ